MIDPVALLAFVPAALALNLTPGADMLFCMGQGLRSGPRAAVAASAGISAGALVHVTVAGLGLGAAVQALPWVFDLIRWVGVGYLLFLAVGAWRGQSAEMPSQPTRNAFRSGFLVNLTNPKVILFVLALIPQFVDPQAGPVLGQFLIFGAIISAGGFVINALVGWFAGRAGAVLTQPSAQRVLGRVTAGIFAALAVRLAFLEKA